ncbi:glycoside hydrolase family 5 protein [Mucidula mucida]|nr:glycoside hydrolase family 5 protein [Mucidula mucida]
MFTFTLSVCLLSTLFLVGKAALPEKIYGVNLGSWLVLEPWMLPEEWIEMGGQDCADCSTCIRSEFDLVRSFPKTADATFAKHWESWFNEADVKQLVENGINTVRIPLGYWIVEPLVKRSEEFYPVGGLAHLKRGLRQLAHAGIAVILDHHALPGVQSPNQMFTGRCTADVEFYTDFNYLRALSWTAVMTALSHVDPDFASVVAIEAVNEPIMDANLTPGYGRFQKNFVQVVRAVEAALGVNGRFKRDDTNVTAAIIEAASDASDDMLREAMLETGPILLQLGVEFSIDSLTKSFKPEGSYTPLFTSFMDINWQHNDPPNPNDAKIGPQLYDNHLYYNFGGVADPNEEAYMKSICNLKRVQNDAALGNSPLVFGEWGLPTQFNATDEFLFKWADAQKLAYSKGAGWIFWNFKVEISETAGDLARQWSYFKGVDEGYLTRDPAEVHDPHVCDPYME